jgi:hypothetical protein
MSKKYPLKTLNFTQNPKIVDDLIHIMKFGDLKKANCCYVSAKRMLLKNWFVHNFIAVDGTRSTIVLEPHCCHVGVGVKKKMCVGGVKRG